jgi:hypothetical protein
MNDEARESRLFRVNEGGLLTMKIMRERWLGPVALLAAVMLTSAPASAQQQQKPNVLVIMGDDIGYWNISPTTRA